MIGKLIMILLPVLALIGGALGGEVLRSNPAKAAPAAGVGPNAPAGGTGAAAHDPAAAHGQAPGDAAAGPAAQSASGKGDGSAAEADLTAASFKFPEQFFVPLVRGGELRGMMVLSLSVEMPAGTEEAVYARENQLRDALLRQLLIHANSGGFDGNFTGEPQQELLRSELVERANTVSPEVQRVLIGDIALQAG